MELSVMFRIEIGTKIVFFFFLKELDLEPDSKWH